MYLTNQYFQWLTYITPFNESSFKKRFILLYFVIKYKSCVAWITVFENDRLHRRKSLPASRTGWALLKGWWGPRFLGIKKFLTHKTKGFSVCFPLTISFHSFSLSKETFYMLQGPAVKNLLKISFLNDIIHYKLLSSDRSLAKFLLSLKLYRFSLNYNISFLFN